LPDGDRTTVTFDDVVARNNENHGFRLSWETDYEVPTNLLARGNGDSNIRVTRDAGINAATIWSSLAVGAFGLKADTIVGGNIETYHPYENDEGPLEANSTVEIETQETKDKGDIEGVPAAADVGVDGTETFTVTDLAVETDEPTVNRETTIEATVENQTDESEDVFLVLRVDEDPTETTTVTVGPADTATASFAPVFATTGEFALSVTAGPEASLSVAPLTRDSYTNGSGAVDTESLEHAIEDWRDGYIDFGLLRETIDVWGDAD
jgi:hypothetical protein